LQLTFRVNEVAEFEATTYLWRLKQQFIKLTDRAAKQYPSHFI